MCASSTSSLAVPNIVKMCGGKYPKLAPKRPRTPQIPPRQQNKKAKVSSAPGDWSDSNTDSSLPSRQSPGTPVPIAKTYKHRNKEAAFRDKEAFEAAAAAKFRKVGEGSNTKAVPTMNSSSVSSKHDESDNLEKWMGAPLPTPQKPDTSLAQDSAPFRRLFQSLNNMVAATNAVANGFAQSASGIGPSYPAYEQVMSIDPVSAGGERIVNSGPILTGHKRLLPSPIVDTGSRKEGRDPMFQNLKHLLAMNNMRDQAPSLAPSMGSILLGQQPSQLPTQVSAQLPTQVSAQLLTQVPTQIPTQVPNHLPSQLPTRLPSHWSTSLPISMPAPSQVYTTGTQTSQLLPEYQPETQINQLLNDTATTSGQARFPIQVQCRDQVFSLAPILPYEDIAYQAHHEARTINELGQLYILQPARAVDPNDLPLLEPQTSKQAFERQANARFSDIFWQEYPRNATHPHRIISKGRSMIRNAQAWLPPFVTPLHPVFAFYGRDLSDPEMPLPQIQPYRIQWNQVLFTRIEDRQDELIDRSDVGFGPGVRVHPDFLNDVRLAMDYHQLEHINKVNDVSKKMRDQMQADLHKLQADEEKREKALQDKMKADLRQAQIDEEERPMREMKKAVSQLNEMMQAEGYWCEKGLECETGCHDPTKFSDHFFVPLPSLESPR